MPELDIPAELKTEFHERCLAAVNRGLGKVAIGQDKYEITVGEEYAHACFSRGEHITDVDGNSSYLWHDLILNDRYVFSKHTEREVVDAPIRPTIASEDVMRQYYIEDLRDMFASSPAESMLIGYLQSLSEAEKLGLLDVSVDEVLEAIAAIDKLVANFDDN